MTLYYTRTATGPVSTQLLHETTLTHGLPLVIRCDKGSHFITTPVEEWCTSNGVMLVPGVAYHPQGQGLVESRMGDITDIIATMSSGGRTPIKWSDHNAALSIASAINTTVCGPINMTPFEAHYGRPPRTPLVSSIEPLNLASLTSNDTFFNIITAYHAHMSNITSRVHTATSVSQLVTKVAYDKKRTPVKFNIGDWVLIYYPTRASKFEPYYRGPYIINKASVDGNFYSCSKILASDVTVESHVSRLLLFNHSRTTPEREALRDLPPDFNIVSKIVSHRPIDGTSSVLEFEVLWATGDVTFSSANELSKIDVFSKYCIDNKIILPKPAAPTMARRRKG